MKLYNTLSRKKEKFVPIKKNHASLYTCGPTVYDHAHIGNLRAIVTYDLLKRYLKYKGFKVNHVMNITDIDDKTIKNSQKENKSIKEFTKFYTKAFLEDIKTLNVELPDIMPKATDEISGMVKIIKILLKKGFAYKTENQDIYFSIGKFKNYGKLANLDNQTLKKGASGRVKTDEYDKEHAHDFALWKAHTIEDKDVFWETEIGKGRPGWHIECSEMSSKYLGQPFDIHMGGVDLIFPHHTNEIAQSEAAENKKFCNYWVHNEHLIVNGQKMSKSSGNFYTLRDLLNKGFDPKSIRYELISSHYRQKLDFREENLKEADATLNRIKEFLIKLDNIKGAENYKNLPQMLVTLNKLFEKDMDDDLNIGRALESIFLFIRSINKVTDKLSQKDAIKIKDQFEKFNQVLGVMDIKSQKIPKEITTLAEKRLNAKKVKDFEAADKIRNELRKKGYQIDDTKDGYIIKKT